MLRLLEPTAVGGGHDKCHWEDTGMGEGGGHVVCSGRGLHGSFNGPAVGTSLSLITREEANTCGTLHTVLREREVGGGCRSIGHHHLIVMFDRATVKKRGGKADRLPPRLHHHKRGLQRRSSDRTALASGPPRIRHIE